MHANRLATLAAAALMSIGLAACGGGGDEQPSAPAVSASALDFKDAPAGVGSIKAFDVTNMSSETRKFNVYVESVSQTSSFYVLGCDSAVPAGLTCTVSVVFKPEAVNASYSAKVVILGNESPEGFTDVVLTGNSSAAVATPAPCQAGMVYVQQLGACLYQ